jgi:large subunit ribosomal protein L13Ae
LSRSCACPPALLLQVGWKHQDAVAELEAKRKAKASKFYEAKKKSLALRAKAASQVAA